ncbi:tetratricopeptide repeat protein [Thalassotalea aquiviva]|uniref:tetratricopeptide repeat protein n=1 Tax=Thalassotalea aquiviva TaxID=3242415 RepID=UPI00352B92C9
MTNKAPHKDDVKSETETVTLNISAQRAGMFSSLLGLFKQRSLTLVVLVLLFIGLYVVMIWLPSSVSTSPKVNTEDFIRQELQKPIDDSPWHEAQQAKYRKQAQEILAKVLEKQKLLEQKQIKSWAETEYQQALSMATEGDLLYRTQKFEQAIATYQQVLDNLTSMESQFEQKFDYYLQSGLDAISNKNAALAEQHLIIASNIKPEDERARKALYRSSVLNQVLALVTQGINALDAQELTNAQNLFQQAYTLDPDSALVQQKLAETDQALKDKAYSKAMSEGFRLLSQNQHAKAIAAFNTAQKIKPQQSDPAQAIAQARNRNKVSFIDFNLNQASEHENQERWQQALEHYQNILAKDDTIVAAKIGKIRTSARAKLDQELSQIIANPNRLTDESVFNHANVMYQEAQKIAQPGVKLTRQLNEINTLFAALKVPVALKIESDNKTQVRLYRVGHLGNFASKELTLEPGDYTLVGSRDGYRDVRKNITLMPKSQGNRVVIACVDKVTNG